MPIVKKALSKKLDIKFLPRLSFVEDNSFEYAEKIERLIKKNKEGKIEDVRLIKEGFSYLSFIFNIFWFLYQKMWKESAALLMVAIGFLIFEESKFIYGPSNILFAVIFIFMLAVNANHWLLEALKKRGYEFRGLVFGSSQIVAKMRFIKNIEEESASKPDSDRVEFDDSIIDPKLHRQLKKLNKKKLYFAV